MKFQAEEFERDERVCLTMADMGSKPVEPVLEDGMSGECVCLQNMVVANGYSSLATILHV